MADAPNIDTMGIKALKEFITAAGLSTADCIDKDDLRKRAQEALAAAKPAPSSSSGSSGATGTKSNADLGGYPCIVTGRDDSGPPADLLIIGLHGLGATNTDLADIPAILPTYASELRSTRVVGVFPQAPMRMMGSAWFNINVMEFMGAMMAPPGPQRDASIAKLIRQKHDGLDECRTALVKLVEEARALAGDAQGPLPSSKVVIAGFSLGAVMALDIALQLNETVGGVVCMNGAPITVDEWASKLDAHGKLRVLLTAGRQDMTMPYEATGWTKQLLESKGVDVKQMSHNGGHEIGGAEILRGVAQFAAAVVSN